MKLCICGLDGCVADNTARFALAEEAKQAYMASHVDPREATNIFWREAFTPAHVALDTLVEGVNEALLDIQEQGYKVVFLTSRPESMREATIQWLFASTVYDADDELVMKAPAFQYVKTVTWKAGMAQTLAMLYGGEDVMFVDDEQTNIDELVKHGSLNGTLHVWCYHSLAEAVKPKAEADTDNPF